MKITKSQLKRIIKEELETLLDEGIIDRMRRGFDQSARSGMLGLGPTKGEFRGASRIGRRLTGRRSKAQKALDIAEKIYRHAGHAKLQRLHKQDLKDDKPLTEFVEKEIDNLGAQVSAIKVVDAIKRLLNRHAPVGATPPPTSPPTPPPTSPPEGEGT